MSILNNTPAAPANPTEGAGNPPAAPAAPAAPSVSFPDNWKDGLPEELRSDPSLGVVHDIPSLAKSFVNAQKMIGADKIPVPGKHATEEDWNGVFQKLGLPKDLKEYALQKGKDSKLDDTFVEKFKASAHAAGILPRNAQKVLDWFEKEYSTQMAEAENNFKVSKEQAMTELKKEWGDAFSMHATAANLAVQEFGGDELYQVLKETGLDSNPTLVKAFAKIGMQLKESEVKGKVPRGGEGALTPQQAQERYNSIMGDTSHPYHLANHPGHKAAVQEVSQLFAAIFPST